MTTEITKRGDISRPLTWILYDGQCSLCVQLARRFERTFARHSFALAPLQIPWARGRLGLSPDTPLTEMRLLTVGGEVLGGAEAVVRIAQGIWWLWPLSVLARVPGGKLLLRAVYQWIANRRNCLNGACRVKRTASWVAWLPLCGWPTFAFTLRDVVPAWLFMWTVAVALYSGAKWLTWCSGYQNAPMPGLGRSLGYLLAWPGMDAKRFLHGNGPVARPNMAEWSFAFCKTLLGVGVAWGATRLVPGGHPLLAGWLGLFGLVFVLHFGLFHLVALAWQQAGVNAQPIMNAPALSASLAEFWGCRWNAAFHLLVRDFAFHPLVRRFGGKWAMLFVFLLSGLIHEAVISVPARGGYGLPTAYFLLQGLALLFERSRLGRNLGLGGGCRGWFFTVVCTAGPAFWLFHPTFVKQVILPFLQIIGAR